MSNLLREIFASTRSIDVQHARPDGGRVQHGVIISGSGAYTAIGDGSEIDRTATTQAFIGNSGAYLDGDGDQAIPVLGTLVTTAIGDAYAPWGEERALLLRTERGWGFLFEHGFEDSPQPKQGERYILHRSAPKSGKYAAATYDAGVRLLNDGPTGGDGQGTTEVGHQGAQTTLKTKGGWKIVEDDTHKKLTISWPDGTPAVVIDNNTNKIEIAGSSGASGDALMRQSDVAAVITAYHTLLTGTYFPANFSTSARGTGWTQTAAETLPTPTGSTKAFSS